MFTRRENCLGLDIKTNLINCSIYLAINIYYQFTSKEELGISSCLSVHVTLLTYTFMSNNEGNIRCFNWCIEVVAAYVSLFVFYLRKKQKQKENKQWADNPYTWMYGIGYTWTEMRSEDRMIQSRILY